MTCSCSSAANGRSTTWPTRSVASELRDTEVLPLYARLSSAEQHRIFQPHRGRRVVLSTNVAETSITVPGVRYVVDAGTARISRYSRRLKVQRLPIEPVSQASANQRAGRCGRVAPGICIRLYTEEDFDTRDEFTEPEILRTNLASVILQMTAIGLGDVGRFPFVEPPDRQAIRDGYLLLDELGALREGRLGAPEEAHRTSADSSSRLPVDPRLGRMVIEAERHGCVREVLVIASALSIQDVRERPKDAPERAAELHRRFDVEGSDLLSIVALWDYLRDRQRELSGNRFRRMCRDEHLNYLRVREWRDLYSQLRQVAGQLKIRPTVDEAHPDRVHQAVLAGLLSHIGVRDGDGREYRGARDARFVIAPGSVLVEAWAEVGDGRRAGRDEPAVGAARRDDPARVGRVDRRHISSSARTANRGGTPEPGERSSPRPSRCSGCRSSRPARSASGRVDPVLAREMFIRHALVAGDWDTRHEFVRANARFVERVALLEARVRRIDLLDDEAVYEFYDERVGRRRDVGSRLRPLVEVGRARPTRPARTRTGRCCGTGRGIRLDDYPDTWTIGDVEYRLTYRFEPDTPLDGATLNVPLTALNQLDDRGPRLARAGLPGGARRPADPIAAQGRPPRADPDERDGGGRVRTTRRAVGAARRRRRRCHP